MADLESSPGFRTSKLSNQSSNPDKSTELAPPSESASDPTEAFLSQPDLSTEEVASLRYLSLDPPGRPESIGRLAHYEILSVIGRGAMGIVVRAIDTQLHRTVAIKLMTPHLTASDQAISRFIREARAAAGINHPNVVTIYSVSEHNGIPFLVMEYVDGRSLMDRIRSDTPLTRRDCIRISAQIADGLAAAHHQGVIHRDIKPANIMLEDGIDRVKITDFGLARVLLDQSELTSQGVVVGTPAYMSPEQVNGLPLDPRSDLFSLGCVMYAMTTGHSPFRGENALGTARRITVHDHVSLGMLNKNVPGFYVKIVDRLLEKDPARRFQAAQEVVDELTTHLAQLNHVGDSLFEFPESKPVGRNYAGSILIGLGVVLALLIMFAAWKRDDGRSIDRNWKVVASPIEKIVTVAKKGEADYRDIAEALDHATQNQEIRVLDSGPYDSILPLIQGSRFEGLTLVSTASTILKSPASRPVLKIHGASRVVIEGFRIETAADQHAIEVTGTCPGIRIERCELVSPLDSGLAVIYLHDGASGTMDAPVRLKNLRIRGGGVGVVIGGLGERKPIRHIEVMESRIRAASPSFGHPVVIQFANAQVSLKRNLIYTGLSAISLSFPRPRCASDLLIEDNSIGDVLLAFTLNESTPDQDITIANNLILDASSILCPSREIGPFARWFQGNRWERGTDFDPSLAPYFDEPGETLSFVSRDPESDDYLARAGSQPPNFIGNPPSSPRPSEDGRRN